MPFLVFNAHSFVINVFHVLHKFIYLASSIMVCDIIAYYHTQSVSKRFNNITDLVSA